MPELPEVQTTVTGLDTHIRNLTITDVWTDYNSAFHMGKDSIKDPVYFTYFKKEIVGAKIIRVTRRAKNILIHISKNDEFKIILVHMKMTGHLLYGDYDRKDRFNRFIHVIFTLSNKKTLELSDMRKFAKVTLITGLSKSSNQAKSMGSAASKSLLDTELEQSLHLAHIGPEPLEKSFTFSVFKDRLTLRPNGKIKTVLMDQSIIAGIGNIYSDEALWRASINPEELVRDIAQQPLQKLYEALDEVLRSGIDFGGDSMSDYRNIDGKRGKFQEQHRAYRKTGTPCTLRTKNNAGKSVLCSGTITRKVVGGRSAHFCNVHQKLQKSGDKNNRKAA